MHRFYHLFDNTSRNQITPRVLTIVTAHDSASQEVHFGLSVCKPTVMRVEDLTSRHGREMVASERRGDPYNRKMGNTIAMGRLKAFKDGREIVAPAVGGYRPIFGEEAKAKGTPLAGSVMVSEDDDVLLTILDWIVRNFPDGNIVRMCESHVEAILEYQENKLRREWLDAMDTGAVLPLRALLLGLDGSDTVLNAAE